MTKTHAERAQEYRARLKDKRLAEAHAKAKKVPKTPRQRTKECRERKKLQKQLQQDLLNLSMPSTSNSLTKPKKVPKTASQRMKEYRERKKLRKLLEKNQELFNLSIPSTSNLLTKPKKAPKTPRQRTKDCRERKKLQTRLQRDLLNLSIPSTSNSSFASDTSNPEVMDVTEVQPSVTDNEYHLLQNSGNMDDFKLLDLVEPHKHLYNRFLKDYNDVELHKKTWGCIAKEMACSAYACYKRFCYLQDILLKEKKRKGAAGVVDPLMRNIFNRMTFVWNHLSNKNNPSLETEEAYVYLKSESEIKCEVELVEEDGIESDNGNHQNDQDSRELEDWVLNYVPPIVIKLKKEDSLNEESLSDLAATDSTDLEASEQNYVLPH